MESLDKEALSAGMARYLSTEVPFFEYLDSVCGRERTVKQRAELDVRLGRINALLNLDSGEKEEVWIPSL